MDRVSRELSGAVAWMRHWLGVERTLSEILSLRGYIVEALNLNYGEENLELKLSPGDEGIARLLHDYYGLNWFDFWDVRQKGPREYYPVVGSVNVLTGDAHLTEFGDHFKDYFKIIRERLYSP